MSPPHDATPLASFAGDVARALQRLGKDDLVLAIHDASFPSRPDEDIGRGSPYTRGGGELLELARALGFNGVQLGPQGETTPGNPSPYDSTLFSKSALSVSLATLVEDGLLPRARLEALVAGRPPGARAHHAYAHRAQRAALEEAFAALGDTARLRAFQAASAPWLDADSRFEARGYAEGTVAHHRAIDVWGFIQMLAHEQHASLRARARVWRLKMFGDLQIGFSERDEAAHRGLFLDTHRMGAPPSRTNPDGQAWGYPVLDPGQRRDGVRRFLELRVGKMLSELDGLRIDHPHGLVCPWVYDARDPDTARAVRRGARLFASPDLPDHPGLARYAIARAEEIDRALPRHADGWVRWLDQAQVDAYSELLDVVMDAARAAGRAPSDIVCEVLSTQPHPLARVMARHGLGRFRVTQKAKVGDARDVYRSDRAEPPDWIMMGNHDTPTVWTVVDRLFAGPRADLEARATYLASRLEPDAQRRSSFAASLGADPRRMVLAMFADLFASDARHVMVFFADLFGERAAYNVPGVVDDANWTLRVPDDYRESYPARAARGDALHLPRALALALRARDGASRAGEDEALARRLDVPLTST